MINPNPQAHSRIDEQSCNTDMQEWESWLDLKEAEVEAKRPAKAENTTKFSP